MNISKVKIKLGYQQKCYKLNSKIDQQLITNYSNDDWCSYNILTLKHIRKSYAFKCCNQCDDSIILNNWLNLKKSCHNQPLLQLIQIL
jgi:hypothetical protein